MKMADKEKPIQPTPKPKPGKTKEYLEKSLPPVDYTPPTPPVKPPKKEK